jgi:hypothetical protein
MGNQRKETSGESTPKFVESMALSKYLVRMLPDVKHGAKCGNKI